MPTPVAKVSGDFELIRLDTGERLRIDMDGTEIRDQVPAPTVEFCDKCQQQKNIINGEFAKWHGEKIMWFCETCK